ncbi:MAG: protein translocase subunit SecD [Acidimicrobiales bacterium]
MRRKKLTPLLFIVLIAAVALGACIITDTSPQLGLDLQGGVAVVLQPTEPASDEAIDQAIEIIRNRVDALGVAEPEIARQGESIVVQLPGVDQQQRALELVGTTAELRFRPVLLQIPGSLDDHKTTTTTGGDGSTTTAPTGETTTTAAGATTTAPVSGQGRSATPFQDGSTSTTVPGTTTTTAPTGEPGALKVTPRQEDDPEATVVLEELDDDGNAVNTYQLGPSQATGEIVASADAKLNQSGQWQVALSMKGGADGIDKFNAIAAQCNPPSQTCPTGQLAIVLDSIVQSAPVIQASSYKKDDIVISGSFTESEAKDLATALRYGKLPVVLEPQTVQTVSPTLGEDSLKAGLAAGLLGLVLVCAYMVFYYRALGFVVVLGLSVWAALLYAIISYIGVSLSLAGVTGIVVSVGVTVDSYVVYFERLKDEVKAGRTLRSSTERAFSRAFRTILAADISSFLGAIVLFQLTVGPVRGFAFFLGVSTILDVVVAYFFTRPIVGILARNRTFTEAPHLGVARGLAAEPVGSVG